MLYVYVSLCCTCHESYNTLWHSSVLACYQDGVDKTELTTSTELTLILHLDLLGKIPAAAVNLSVVSQPLKWRTKMLEFYHKKMKKQQWTTWLLVAPYNQFLSFFFLEKLLIDNKLKFFWQNQYFKVIEYLMIFLENITFQEFTMPPFDLEWIWKY